MLTLKDVKDVLSADLLWGEQILDQQVSSCCGSDLMSDVLAFVKNQAILLTGLLNPQVVRTAEMMDMVCIVFVRNKRPTEEMLQLAAEHDMVVLATSKRMYEACGKLYQAGLYTLGESNE